MGCSAVWLARSSQSKISADQPYGAPAGLRRRCPQRRFLIGAHSGATATCFLWSPISIRVARSQHPGPVLPKHELADLDRLCCGAPKFLEGGVHPHVHVQFGDAGLLQVVRRFDGAYPQSVLPGLILHSRISQSLLHSFAWNAACRIVPMVEWPVGMVSQQICCQQNCYIMRM